MRAPTSPSLTNATSTSQTQVNKVSKEPVISASKSGSMTSFTPSNYYSIPQNNNNNEVPEKNSRRSADILPVQEKTTFSDESPFSVSMADSSSEYQEHSILTKCAAEFVCVFIFVFVGSMQGQAVGVHDGIIHAALAHGLTIFILASAFGSISGAHINPAISLAIALIGKISPISAICYMISQLAGGFVGALMVRAILTEQTYIDIHAGATLCGPGIAVYQGFLAEAITTFMLVQSVLLTAVDTDKQSLAPLAIGLTLTIDILAAGNISGASMNPARSFGPNVAGSIFIHKHLESHFWSFHWIYWVGPITGSVIAVALYKTFFAREGRALP